METTDRGDLGQQVAIERVIQSWETMIEHWEEAYAQLQAMADWVSPRWLAQLGVTRSPFTPETATQIFQFSERDYLDDDQRARLDKVLVWHQQRLAEGSTVGA
jgi:hypothetical protein